MKSGKTYTFFTWLAWKLRLIPAPPVTINNSVNICFNSLAFRGGTSLRLPCLFRVRGVMLQHSLKQKVLRYQKGCFSGAEKEQLAAYCLPIFTGGHTHSARGGIGIWWSPDGDKSCTLSQQHVGKWFRAAGDGPPAFIHQCWVIRKQPLLAPPAKIFVFTHVFLHPYAETTPWMAVKLFFY